ncbi:MAG: hypothetical protein IPG24_10965 [Leptospiraceae bacterium]|nr:hypothetical protein [Leptospiraceae bacterium]
MDASGTKSQRKNKPSKANKNYNAYSSRISIVIHKIKMLKNILLISVLLLANSICPQDSKLESEKIYQSVLKATFVNDKIEVAKAFLSLNECKEGVYTRKLLKDSHYWNREAGIYIVGECKNPNLDKEMCKLFLEDHMIRTPIRELIKKNPNRFVKDLIAIYKNDIWDPSKKELFQIYEITQDENTSNFLQSIIKNQKSPDRSLAIQSLLKHPKKQNDSFIRSYIKDKELRKYSLQWIVENGSNDDLPLFQEILSNTNSKMEDLVFACMAIGKWGNEKEKKSTYLRFLKEDNQSLLPSVFFIFNKMMDENLFSEISRLSRTGKTQTIRTEAILQIKDLPNQKKYAFLILFLQEEYQTQTQADIGDAFATVITFGIHGIFKGLQEKNRKNKFESIQSELIQILQKETGERFTTASEWKAWANQKKHLPITITYE